MKDLQTKEPGPHVDNVRGALHQLVEHLRRDAALVDDSQAAAMFETAAEVIHGLEVSLEHYKARAEPAWQKRQSPAAR
jgi:hypothetical protein